MHGKLAVLDIEESGRKIGEKLSELLSGDQRKELSQFLLERKSDNPVSAEKYPLTEIREGNLYLCPELRLVTVREQEVELTVKEFEILSILIMNPKRVFTYDMLIDLIWHEEYDYYSRKAVNNHVSNLRRKLRVTVDEPDYIKSVYGVGYKFEI